MLTLIKNFRDNEDGASLIEYSLLVGLISIAVIATIQLIRGDLGTIWTATQTATSSAANP